LLKEDLIFLKATKNKNGSKSRFLIFKNTMKKFS